MAPDQSLPSPDITLFLTLPSSQASQRSDYGTERYESVELQDKVRQEFGRVAQRVMAGNERNGQWKEVDASGTIEQVGQRIWDLVEGVVKAEKDEVGRLWT